MARFDDYVRDIPMEIGHRFYPRPEILMPRCMLPCIPDSSVKYDFEVEHRARQAYDTRNDVPDEPNPSKVESTPILNTSVSTNSLPSRLEVLQPSRIDNITTGTATLEIKPAKPVSYEEFEAKGNVFDELEWKSIDDKQALKQATPTPPKLNETKIMNGHTVSYAKPPGSSNSASSSSSTTKVPLRQRLLTKGYRENLVNVAMAKVPQDRVVHIEYYMKGMSTLEKRGVSVESSLTYLLESGVTDKEHVLQRAQTADQLLSMGFSSENVFPALLKAGGDRLKALDALLSS